MRIVLSNIVRARLALRVQRGRGSKRDMDRARTLTASTSRLLLLREQHGLCVRDFDTDQQAHAPVAPLWAAKLLYAD